MRPEGEREGGQRPRRWIGRWLVVVALLHVALGVVGGGARLGAVVGRGWNALASAPPPERLAVWFVAAGLLLAVLGLLADAAEAEGGRLPATAGWLLLAVAAVGVVLDPLSGFWLLGPPALGWVLRARRRGCAPTRARPAPD